MLNATTSQKYLLAASLWSQSKQFSDFRSGLSSALDQQLDRVSWRQDLQEVSEVPKIIFPPKCGVLDAQLGLEGQPVIIQESIAPSARFTLSSRFGHVKVTADGCKIHCELGIQI